MNEEKEKQPKILCVDDESTILKIYETALKPEGYLVKLEKSSVSAFDTAKAFLPDLIISDVVMPEISGIDFCNQIRADAVLRRSIFILASSKKIDSADAVAGIEAGADDYLKKPFDRQTLLAKVKAFLRIKFLQDDLRVSNKKLNKAISYLKEYKNELEKKNRALQKEKEMLENSLKQISLMMEERDQTNIELERFNHLNENNLDNLISVLSAIIESKRQYHRGHSKKVAEIAMFIARQFGADDGKIREIEIASLLHELGKISISDELAMKPPEEYSQKETDFLAQHPVRGAAMLEKFTGFEKIAGIIRHCHEHVDGTGIPDGFKSNEIPLGARIITAASLFDNLVFRKKDSVVTSALERLEDEVGSRFDPLVIHYLHKYANSISIEDQPRTRQLSIFDMEPDMVLASGIFTLKGTKLLPINTVLTEASILKIAQYAKKDPIEETVFIKE